MRPPNVTLDRAVRVGILLGVSFETMADVLEVQPHELAGAIATIQAQRNLPRAPQLSEVPNS